MVVHVEQPPQDRRRRQTRQGSLVGDVLAEIGEFRSARELHAELQRRDAAVGVATVYRHLQDLADRGEVDVLRTDDGEALYRRCSTAHHHHLVCRGCGLTLEVEGPEVERWADRVAAAAGFADVTHTVELFGRCPQCDETR
jgi:Fur family ferric uptake transcriptional regulator